MEKGLSVFIGAVTDEKLATGEVTKRILKIGGVERVYELTGDFDVLIFARSGSVTELNRIVEAIRAAQGVISSTTYLVLDTHSTRGHE